MIKVLIIDDEPLALRQMELYISKVPFLELLASCNSAEAARPFIPRADAIFIDINMPDMSGMDFVKQLENPPLVVFSTAYSEYAVEGFKVDAVDYLLKPFSLAEFQKSALKLRARFMERQTGHIIFRVSGKDVRVDFRDICRVEAQSEYIKVYLTGREPLLVLYSLTKLAEQMPRGLFCRIHRSHIVSVQQIGSIAANSVTLKDGTVLPVSETYRDSLKEAFR